MGRPVARHGRAGLRERGSELGMRVHDTAYGFKRLIQSDMGRRIGRWVERPFHLSAIQIDKHHVFRLQLVVRYAARLDRQNALTPVNHTHIPERQVDEPVFGKQHVRPV